MSINTAMTAIADKIRGLLGLSGAMGLDAMASNLAVEQTNIADAYAVVSSKGGTVPESKVSGNLAAAIGTISTGGLDTSDATATAADILSGKTAYVNGQKVTGSIASRSAQTITPGTSDQTIASGQYLSGKQTIKGDSNLLAENIRSGVTVFGVGGTYAGTGGLDTSDATATAKDMAEGVTAYVNGEKVTGTLPVLAQLGLGNAAVDKDGAYITMEAKPPFKRIIHDGTTIHLRAKSEKFGDAAAEDVAAGKTFTSAAGLKVTGTHECAAPSLQSKTVTPSESQQVVSPDSGYDGLSSVTVGAVSRTYVGSGVTKKSAATYTPGTSDQTIASGQYLSGKQTIKGDANLLPGNIKSGVSVFGVDGAYVGTVDIDTSDATAAADNIEEGKTAYVNGEKITGSLTRFDGLSAPAEPGFNESTEKIKLTYTNTKKRLFSANGTIVLSADASNFGDATAADVAAGKTFTSAAGLKVTGTHECAAPRLQSKTVLPSESQQTVSPDSGYDGLSDITVEAVSNTYIGSGVTKKSAATYTPGTADQTIASGQYLSGKQTIKGDANLVAENIKSGVSIFGVDGAFAASNSGKYAWEKYEVLNYEITKTSLGGTKPTDMAYTRYGDYSITDDGHFVLSGSTPVYGYHYISGQSSNAKSIYVESFTLNGTAYSMWTLSDERIDDTKGRKFGYVVSDGSSDYPEDGVQDGYWYVKIK